MRFLAARELATKLAGEAGEYGPLDWERFALSRQREGFVDADFGLGDDARSCTGVGPRGPVDQERVADVDVTRLPCRECQ